ncbi:hypothetical protein TNIN_431553 [Trichonephila inaurata madagascariensis]|uniref:Uncharacterized protein n=1 Tax=Trichonephila inaurata madagascariensis TaxID=2747483 RepID=A0A8X6X7L9_9ARAC|nr:hypothetical protein TNIN_431553 [Trichonephila inaurata madagascariensis]
MIIDYFWPELKYRDLDSMWFQQDSATSHSAHVTINLLKNKFDERVISRNEPVDWPLPNDVKHTLHHTHTHRTSYARNVRNAVGDVAQPALDFSSAQAPSAMSLMKDYSDYDPSSVGSIYGSHVITGVIHPISGAVPVPVSSQRRHKKKRKGGRPSKTANNKKNGGHHQSSPKYSKNNSRAGIDQKNGGRHPISLNRSKNNSSAGIDKRNGGRHPVSPHRSKNNSSAGIDVAQPALDFSSDDSMHDPSSVDSIYGSQRRHQKKRKGGSPSKTPNNRKNGGRLHTSTKDSKNNSSVRIEKKKGRRQEANLNSSRNNSSDGIDKQNGSGQQISPKRSRKNSSAGIDKKNRLQSSPNGSKNNSGSVIDSKNNSSTGIVRKNDGRQPSSSNRSRKNSSARIDKKGGRRQNSPKRSRNTSSTRKDDHVITISGAVPVPVSSQRRHKSKETTTFFFNKKGLEIIQFLEWIKEGSLKKGN